jgi:hypothetical protein
VSVINRETVLFITVRLGAQFGRRGEPPPTRVGGRAGSRLQAAFYRISGSFFTIEKGY